jgi:hypothetical protein
MNPHYQMREGVWEGAPIVDYIEGGGAFCHLIFFGQEGSIISPVPFSVVSWPMWQS